MHIRQGLAILVAALAMGTATTSVAQGAEFTALNTSTGKYEDAFIHGTQTTALTFSAGKGFSPITCSTAEFGGSSKTGKSPSLELTPVTSGCTNGPKGTVETIDKGWTWHVGVVVLGGGIFVPFVTFQAGEHITKVSLEGKVACTVTTFPQELGKGGEIESIKAESGNKLALKLKFSNVRSTTSGGLSNCGIADGEHTAGTIEGTILLNAKSFATGGGMDLAAVE
jgi:hypothetical protein